LAPPAIEAYHPAPLAKGVRTVRVILPLLVLIGGLLWYLADRHDCYWHGLDQWALWGRCVLGLSGY